MTGSAVVLEDVSGSAVVSVLVPEAEVSVDDVSSAPEELVVVVVVVLDVLASDAVYAEPVVSSSMSRHASWRTRETR